MEKTEKVHQKQMQRVVLKYAMKYAVFGPVSKWLSYLLFLLFYAICGFLIGRPHYIHLTQDGKTHTSVRMVYQDPIEHIYISIFER